MKPGKQTILVILFAVFALPPLLSWYLFNYTDLGKGRNSGAHGLLVAPPRPLPDWSLVNPAHKDAAETRLHGKWTLVYPLNGQCLEACLRNLYKMRQLRLAAGKHAGRVQRAVLVVNGERDAPTTGQLLDYPGQMLLFPGDIDNDTLTSLFRLTADDRPFDEDRLYLVDPLGNLMMIYPATTPPDGIIKDLNRLLRYSRTG